MNLAYKNALTSIIKYHNYLNSAEATVNFNLAGVWPLIEGNLYKFQIDNFTVLSVIAVRTTKDWLHLGYIPRCHTTKPRLSPASTQPSSNVGDHGHAQGHQRQGGRGGWSRPTFCAFHLTFDRSKPYHYGICMYACAHDWYANCTQSSWC